MSLKCAGDMSPRLRPGHEGHCQIMTSSLFRFLNPLNQRISDLLSLTLVMKSLEKISEVLIVSYTKIKLILCNLHISLVKVFEMLNSLFLRKSLGTWKIPQHMARLLFSDFSFAFNKMQPHVLITRLASHFSLLSQLLTVLLDFLTDRTQCVLVNGNVSNTGSPQGCLIISAFYSVHT